MWYAEWVGWQDMRASFPLLNSPQPTCTLLLTPHCSFDTMNLVKIMLKLTWHNHPPDRFWQSCWYYFDRVSLVQSWYIQRGSFLPLARNYLAWAICKSLRIFSLSIFWNIILKYFSFGCFLTRPVWISCIGWRRCLLLTLMYSCSIAHCGPAALLLKAVFSEIFSVQCSGVTGCGRIQWGMRLCFLCTVLSQENTLHCSAERWMACRMTKPSLQQSYLL